MPDIWALKSLVPNADQEKTRFKLSTNFLETRHTVQANYRPGTDRAQNIW